MIQAMLINGTHVTVCGMEFELVARAKMGSIKGWMVRQVEDGKPQVRERFLCDTEITGVLDAKTGQYFLMDEREYV
jgi:hypothetical protein